MHKKCTKTLELENFTAPNFCLQSQAIRQNVQSKINFILGIDLIYETLGVLANLV